MINGKKVVIIVPDMTLTMPTIKRAVRKLLRMPIPRASDTVTGIIGPKDIRLLAEKPVLTDDDQLRFHNPSKQMQERFVGSSFDDAFSEAARFLNHLLEIWRPSGLPADASGAKILDYGCGWGRMLRLLRSKDELAQVALYGCDPIDDAIDVCRRSIPNVSFTCNELYPPTDYRSDLFDVIYAYSVFSHLSEPYHRAWAAEFARVLKPGGIAFVTTQSRHFILACRELREGKQPIRSAWHENLSKLFTDPGYESRYDAGEFLFAGTGGGARLVKDAYGEAIVPRKYFQDTWGEVGFDLDLWWEHHDPNGQNRVLLRKRADSQASTA